MKSINYNNVVNNGFIFYNNALLFSNLKDGHKLYRQIDNNQKKISEVRPKSIIGNNNKVYYTDNIGGRIYEINYDGSNEKIIYKAFDYEVEYCPKGEKIISSTSNQINFIEEYDGLDTVISNLLIYENYIIFIEGENLKTLNLNDGTVKNIFYYEFSDTVPFNVIEYKNKIYFINEMDGKVYRIDCSELADYKPTQEIVIETSVRCFNIYNDDIFFVDETERNVYRYSLLSRKTSILINNLVSKILVATGKIFYINDADRERIYVYDIQNGESIALPPKFIRNMNYCNDILYFYDNNDELYKFDIIKMSICN